MTPSISVVSCLMASSYGLVSLRFSSRSYFRAMSISQTSSEITDGGFVTSEEPPK